MVIRRPLVTAAGVLREIPAGDTLPADTVPGNDLVVGESTILRSDVGSSVLGIASGSLRLTFFTGRRSETTTQVRVITGTTAAGVTPTLCRVGLYEVAASGDGTLVAATANDITLFAAASTTYTRSWSAGYSKLAGARYAVGLLVVTVAATPTFVGAPAYSQVNAELGAAPRLCGAINAQTDLPAGFTAGQILDNSIRIYTVVLP